MTDYVLTGRVLSAALETIIEGVGQDGPPWLYSDVTFTIPGAEPPAFTPPPGMGSLTICYVPEHKPTHVEIVCRDAQGRVVASEMRPWKAA